MIERYTRPPMGAVWSLENKFKKWLEIEILASEAWAELGVIPREAAEKIRRGARFTVERVLELEKETRHDVVAFCRCIAEGLGDESKYIHYGLTSYDVVDTALSVLLQESSDMILAALEKLSKALHEQALRHKKTVMIGRTHGVHAEPTTLGLKFALWYAENERNIERMRRAKDVIGYGKISGAVGTFAHIDPFVEEYVCRRLGLKPAPISTQILQRDRHAEYLCSLAIIASSLDKFATEIRGLQKTEIRELEEPFYVGQKGSSAMPHKRNPVSCEQISGLARVVRANVQAALENIPLWHERDISHSSVERVILPDSSILVDYMLHQMSRIINELHVYPENMLCNLEKSYGLIYSQRVLLRLVEKGLRREEAYDLVQRYAMESWKSGKKFHDLLASDPSVASVLTAEELAECFDYSYYLRRVDTIFERLGLD